MKIYILSTLLTLICFDIAACEKTTHNPISEHVPAIELQLFVLNFGINNINLEKLMVYFYKTNAKKCLNIHNFYNGHTLLMIQSYRGDVTSVQHLLERNVNVNVLSESGETALTLASREGHHDVVDLLLKYNADVNTTARFGMTSLMTASMLGHTKTVEVLLKYDVNINQMCQFNMSAFTLALYRNRTDVIQLFLKMGLHKKTRSLDTKTLEHSLFDAVYSGNVHMLDLLVSHIVDPNVASVGLLAALEKQNYRAAEIVLNHHNINSIMVNDTPILILLAGNGSDSNIEFLLRKKADVNIFSNVYGMTALMTASTMGHLSTVRLLLKYKANVEYESKNNYVTISYEKVGSFKFRQSALLSATSKGHEKIVELLLKHRSNKNVDSEELMYTFLAAVINGSIGMVDIFLKHGVNVSKEINGSVSPFSVAVHSNNVEVVELFLQQRTINNKTIVQMNTLVTALGQASSHGYSEIVELLLNHITDIESVKQCMLLALQKHQHSVLHVYFKHVDINSIFLNGLTLLVYELSRDDDENVDFLLRNNADVNGVTQLGGFTPLMMAIERNYITIVQLLLTYKANVNYRDTIGLTALYLSVITKNAKMVELLLQHKADPNIQSNEGLTPLMYAANDGSTAIVELLIKHGADVNKVASKGNSALLVAAEKGHDDIVKLLIEHKANVNYRRNPLGETALFVASRNGNYKTVELLLKNGANVDAENTGAIRHLMVATARGYTDIVKMHLKYKADVNRVNKENENALMIATYMRHLKIIKLLLTHNTDIHIKNIHGETALDIATEDESLDIKYILKQYYKKTAGAQKVKKDITEKQESLKPPVVDESKNTQTKEKSNRDLHEKRDMTSFFTLTNILLSSFLLFLMLLVLHSTGKYIIVKNRESNIIFNDEIQENIEYLVSYFWEFFYNVTTMPLLLQNVWGCDKTRQPNESGFFRLLNFRGKLHSSTHIQEVSPNCNDCFVTPGSAGEITLSTNIYLETLLLLEYIKRIVTIIDEKLPSNVNVKDAEILRIIRQLSIEVSVALGTVVQPQLTSSDQNVYLQLQEIKIKTDILSGKKFNLSQMANEDCVKITEPQLICSIFDLNDLFENYLLDLDIEFIEHRDLLCILKRWLENTVQAIEETDRSVSLYDCMLRIGLSDEIANCYTDYVSEEFINMYSLLYWITKYFKGLILSNPLTTEITSAHLFENTSSYNIWETCDIQRTDYDALFTIKVLNLQSQNNFTLEDLEMANNKVKKLRKKNNSESCHYYYHATSLQFAEDIIQNGIRVEEGEKRLDFSHGGGFYVINNFKTAMKWTRRFKQHNPAQAVIIYKVQETEMESGNGLKFDDVTEWRQVITACRKGFPRSPEVSKIRDKLRRADFIEGFLCSNGRQVTYGADPQIYEDGEFRPIQTCIVNDDFARSFGSHSNIFGIVIFRNV